MLYKLNFSTLLKLKLLNTLILFIELDNSSNVGSINKLTFLFLEISLIILIKFWF